MAGKATAAKRGGKREFSDEEKAAYFAEKQAVRRKASDDIDAAFEALCAGIQRGETEAFKNYLTQMANLPHYSYFNTMLLYMQNPNITLCNTYARWQALGYQVNQKGAMAILVPTFKKVQTDDGEEEEVRRSFVLKNCVFDISQTVPIEGKAVNFHEWANIGDDDNGFIAKLEAASNTLGVNIQYKTVEQDPKLAGGTRGYAQGTEVVVLGTLPKALRLKTTIHEIAHTLLHTADVKFAKDCPDRHVKEWEAEAVAFMVAHKFGVDTSDYSFDYLINWKATPEGLRGRFNRMQKAARQIIEAVMPETKVNVE
jgi:hypothetical protein